ncbi:type IV pilus secretin PilQ [Desulfosoma caldarium]|uniref:Type IV pilus secretin PilQ/predicted competence protein n=1 Tax=Desulfosoma caldarium TaxID=610254 RepID=A0A3N1VJR2_9BACT|nr:type IV pilus secretin PilQ [Desulfosoma caldarium]ROR03046.1 type IV pilus secretin PilQ/predicted competence protein [Desulfosoma caldarium]
MKLWNCSSRLIRTVAAFMVTTVFLVSGAVAQAPTAASSPAQAPASDGDRVRVFGVQAEDFPDRTEVVVITNKPPLHHRTVRQGDAGFSIVLEGVETSLGFGTVPTASKRVGSMKVTTDGRGGFFISGRMASGLERLESAIQGDRLVVRLYPLEALGKTPSKAAVSSRVTRQHASSFEAGTHSVSAGAWPAGMDSSGALFEKTYRGKPISLDLQDADLSNVLRLLADVSGMNIVVEPDVSGKVTLKVENIPWDQVLDMVLMMNRLGHEEVGGVIRIAKQEKLKQEMKEREERLKIEQQLLRTQKDLGELDTAYLQINYANPAEIAAKISEIKSDDGKISVDQRTGIILYTDYPARIAAARGIIGRLDIPTKQVLIEARIVQLNTTASRDLGVQWGFSLTKTTDHQVDTRYAVNHPVTATSTASLTVGKLVGTTLWNLDLRLLAAEQAGRGKIISAPRVLTMNHVKATISQGTQIPYQAQSQDGISTEFKDATLELAVTPHVTPDGRIRLQIQAKKEAPNFTQVIPGQPPAIDSRKVDTELLVDDGATVVIGGIIEENESDSESRTPGVHKVPVLGHLFKSKSVRMEKNELLIFINPQIVDVSSGTVRAGS